MEVKKKYGGSDRPLQSAWETRALTVFGGQRNFYDCLSLRIHKSEQIQEFFLKRTNPRIKREKNQRKKEKKKKASEKPHSIASNCPAFATLFNYNIKFTLYRKFDVFFNLNFNV